MSALNSLERCFLQSDYYTLLDRLNMMINFISSDLGEDHPVVIEAKISRDELKADIESGVIFGNNVVNEREKEIQFIMNETSKCCDKVESAIFEITPVSLDYFMSEPEHRYKMVRICECGEKRTCVFIGE